MSKHYIMPDARNQPAPAGRFELFSGFFVEVRQKPDDKHIKNMSDAFGWKWVPNEQP